MLPPGWTDHSLSLRLLIKLNYNVAIPQIFMFTSRKFVAMTLFGHFCRRGIKVFRTLEIKYLFSIIWTKYLFIYLKCLSIHLLANLNSHINRLQIYKNCMWPAAIWKKSSDLKKNLNRDRLHNLSWLWLFPLLLKDLVIS